MFRTNSQKQSLEGVLRKRYFQKLRKIHRKKLVSESLFQKSCRLWHEKFLKKRLQDRCFLENITKYSRTPSFIEHLWWLLLNSTDTKSTISYHKHYTIPLPRLQDSCFVVNIAKFPRTPCFIEHLWWLLLSSTNTTSTD